MKFTPKTSENHKAPTLLERQRMREMFAAAAVASLSPSGDNEWMVHAVLTEANTALRSAGVETVITRLPSADPSQATFVLSAVVGTRLETLARVITACVEGMSAEDVARMVANELKTTLPQVASMAMLAAERCGQ